MTVRSSLALSALLLAACQGSDDDLSVVDGIPDVAHPSNAIYGGSAPDAWYHGATVALHQVVGGSTYSSPFCSGTLITTDVVLTAGHCVEAWGGSVMSPSSVKIYVGDNPSADLASHDYSVSEISRHSSYNAATLVGDIALIRLSSAVTEAVTPVNPLPSAQGFTNADAGMTVNFAGFGYDESGAYGDKLQVDMALGGLGCGGASGCSGASTTYQVGYSQSGGTGPCSGDSGGPMFVFRGANTYVGAVTSYGDAACTRYGVSTRADAYESWINDFIGAGGGGDTADTGTPAPADCTGWENSYSGTLSGTGDYDSLPSGSYYYAPSGTHQAELDGPSGVDFDLYLYRYQGGSWRIVGRAEGSTADETMTKSSRSGNHLWNVYAYSGSGSYSLCTNHP